MCDKRKIAFILGSLISSFLWINAQTVTHTSVPSSIDSDAIGTGVPPTQISSTDDFILTISNLEVGTSYRVFNQLKNGGNVQFAGFARVPFQATSETMTFNITELGWGFFSPGILVDEETATWSTQLRTDETPSITIDSVESSFLVDDPSSTPIGVGTSGLLNGPEDILVVTPFNIDYTVTGSLRKRIIAEVNAEGTYAFLGLAVDDVLLIDNVDIPSSNTVLLDFIVEFPALGDINLEVFTRGSNITISSLVIEDTADTIIPEFREVTDEIGMTYPAGLKYNGPTIADLDSDGFYDLVLNNHNDDPRSPSTIFMNNGDGTVRRGQKLSEFGLQDLHGSGAADTDNDGDLDLMITLGGGNGLNPVPPVFYQNNDGNLLRRDGDVGFSNGGRGRSPRWGDFDNDGDLDLALFNAPIPNSTGPVNIFYANRGDGTFNTVNVSGLEDFVSDHVLITDLNKDHIEDVITLSPLSIWMGRGDFSFENVTNDWLPGALRNRTGGFAATDIDIDNDGDLDLYIANGTGIFLTALNDAVDFDPETGILDGRTSGFQGRTPFTFSADGDIRLYEVEFNRANQFEDDFPIFLGSSKTVLESTINIPFDPRFPEKNLMIDQTITQAMADGFPTDRSANGMYIGYVGNNQWEFEVVRNGNVAFSINYSIDSVSDLTSGTNNLGSRNNSDFLLRNDLNNGVPNFVDVSEEWNIPRGGNHWGVTTGDFNNDGFADLYVNRYGYVRNRRTDYMLLNTGQGSFDATTSHGAKNLGSRSHGDMGQAFDFDMDGDVDILGADDEIGIWHLYKNDRNDNNNYAIVKVGYSPVSNVDAIGAEVTVTTASNSYFRRVGSAGEVFSQSLLNMIHFGLGAEDQISNINVRWRNGEVAEFNNESANQIFDTSLLDPTSLAITPDPIEVRVGTTTQASLEIVPVFANRDVIWSSNDPSIATVDENGIVEGLIEGQSTTITATSVGDNSIIAQATVNVVTFFPVDVASVTLSEEAIVLVEQNTVTITATVAPADADEQGVLWSSSDEAVVTVDQNGLITAIEEGQATITATSVGDNTILDSLDVTVRNLVAASLELLPNRQSYIDATYGNEDSIEVSVDYHAGTGNSVIRGTNRGIRYFLRHLQKDFEGNSKRDIVISDESVIGTESGSSTVVLNLDERPANPLLIPTADLPGGGLNSSAGEFYFLFVSFENNNGERLETQAFPISIVEGTLSVDDFNLDSGKGFALFPNPSEDFIFLVGIDNVEYNVVIRDLSSRVVFSKEVVNNSNNQGLNISNLSPGTYLITVSQGDSTETLKFVKSK